MLSDLIAGSSEGRTFEDMANDTSTAYLGLLTLHGVLTLAHSDTWDGGDAAMPCPTGCIGHYAGDEHFFPEASTEGAIRAAADGELGPVNIVRSAEDATEIINGRRTPVSRVRLLEVTDIFALTRVRKAGAGQPVYLVDVELAYRNRAVFAFKALGPAAELFYYHEGGFVGVD